MKKIFITGGGGFFASRFSAFYRKQYEILAPAHRELDITDESAVRREVESFRPDLVLHAAAVTSTKYCEEHPDIAQRVNADASVNLGKAAQDVGAKMIFISTEQVFNGNEEAGPYNEECNPVPDTVYGKTKLEAEQRLSEIVGQLWIPRFTWLFGLPQRECSAPSDILWGTVQSILRGESVTASKHEFRGMTDVQEMVVNLPKLLQQPCGIYHMGATNEESRYAVVRTVIEALGLGSRLPGLLVEDKEKYLERPRDIRLDTAKAQAAGIVFTDTQEAVRKCIADYSFTC
jgi:dTDP-4-dehydrorhamnose reductase